MYPVVLDARLTPPREFHERDEAGCVPAVIRNIPYSGGSRGGDDDATGEEKKECDGGGARTDGDQWPAVRRWGLDALAADPRLSDDQEKRLRSRERSRKIFEREIKREIKR